MQSEAAASGNITQNQDKHESVLCSHCRRTSKNGIRCLGMCVADNDY
ncbi:Zn ribbon-like protein [cyanobiont of Ornithocercus magnificus]|nr:Zn ribbon-like protein [cyanobiont of Ornithocercus magnificus]